MVGQDGSAEGDVDVFGVPLSTAVSKKTPDKRRNKLRCNYKSPHITDITNLEWQPHVEF